MSLWRREAALELRIGAGDWRLQRAGDLIARAHFDSFDDMVRSFESTGIESPDSGEQRLAVVVHEQWVRSFAVQPPAGLRSLGELRALARARLEQLYGIDASQWIFRGEWSGKRGFVVTAMPVALVDAVRAFCGRAKMRLTAIVPQWVHVLAAKASPSPLQWWAIIQEGVLSVVLSNDGRLEFARSVRLATDAGEDEVRAMAERERMRSGLAADTSAGRVLHIDLRADAVSPLQVRSASCTAHDAARSDHLFSWPRGHRAWPTIAVAVGLVALATAGAWRWSALAEEQSALERDLAKARAAALPIAARVRPDSKPLPRREVDAVNAVAHRLNTPWPDIFAALEQTMPGNVALLGIEPDTGQARLRGSARAADHRAMVDYVDRLSSRWPFGQARLVRHEMDDKNPARPLKFQFEASLRSTEGPR